MTDESGFQVDERAPLHYQEQVERFMRPFVDAMVAVSVTSGDSVLDVACGTGFATRSAASVVGPAGRVDGIDINKGMIATARTVQSTAEADISWQVASALDLPFGDDEFDAVICQQGAQFFPDVAAGLKEMARVTRPGGRIAATVWSAVDDSPFLATEFEMLVRFCGTDPGALGSTFIDDESPIARWFRDAGLGDASIEVVEESVSIPSIVEYVPQHLKALPWSGGFSDLADGAKAEALAWMGERLAKYETGGGIDVPFRSYLATTVV